jgi:hypothetical protein
MVALTMLMALEGVPEMSLSERDHAIEAFGLHG